MGKLGSTRVKENVPDQILERRIQELVNLLHCSNLMW
jgi:hypothetical protein